MYLKSEDVKKIDKHVIERLGISGDILMENAGLAILRNINENIDNISIVCGSGNNGGDGLVLSRHLLSRDRNIKIFIIGNESKLNNSVKLNYKILKNLKADITFIEERKDLLRFKNNIKKSNLIVDCIFGIGLSREIEGIYKEIIEYINNSGKEVLAVDTPSGFNHSTGDIYEVCIKADKTVTFIGEKFGFKNDKSEEYTGEVEVEQISIPLNIVKKIIGCKYEK